MSTQTRHPAGVPVGGRFAPQSHAEADVSLSDAAGVRVDTGSIEVASGSLGRMTIETVPGSPLPPIEIVGDHCHLRPFRSDDLHLVEEASRDGFIPLITTVPSEWSPDRGRAFIDRQNCRHSSGEGWSLAIVDRGPDLAIGQIGLWTSDLHKGRAEIGYWVVASGRGRGAASHALETLSEWAFEHLDIDRLSVFVEPWNTASIKAAERSGFRREGMLRNWERVGGVPRDMWSFVRTRPDHANSDADGEARVRTG